MGNHYYIFARCHDLNQNTATICSGNSRLAQRWEVVGQVEHVCIICSSKIKNLAKSKVTSPPPHPNFLAMKETKNSGKDKRKDPSGSGHSVDLNKISSKAEQSRFHSSHHLEISPLRNDDICCWLTGQNERFLKLLVS